MAYGGATQIYYGVGCTLNGARGFNVAVVDPATGALMGPVMNFDTYSANPITGEPWLTMINYLNSVPTGALIMIAVGDDAGLTPNILQSCARRSGAWLEQGLQTLEALGSTQIRGYCFRDSWAMATVKGEGRARSEQLGKGGASASAQSTLSLP